MADSFMIRRRPAPVPVPLRVQGAAVRLTPSPDDAELAARALLESLCDRGMKGRKAGGGKPEKGTADYYRSLSRKIGEAREAEALAALRLVAYTEQELKSSGTPPDELEAGLYRHLDTAERRGGVLLGRWRHCLAECIVRQMDSDI